MRIKGCHRAVRAKVSGVCLTALTALSLLFVCPAPGFAQTAIDPIAPGNMMAPAAIDPFAPGVLVDFDENMRTFIQSISSYARSFNPQFLIIVKDGMGLVGKPDPEDDTRIFPARAYMRAIDGVMETTLLDETITTPEGKADPGLEAIVKRRAADLAMVREAGLKVFGLEFSTDSKTVNARYSALANKKVIPFVAENPQLTTVPRHPKSAYKANANTIAAVADVQNYLYLANGQSLGTARDLIGALRNTNHDMVVVDVFHKRKPLTRQDVNWLKYKKLGAPRLVLAQIDVSSATSFQYFWKSGWGKGSPPFVFGPVREDPDRFRTVYWDPGWQAIITGDTNSYIYGLIDLGFDGVVLTGTDAWRYFDSGGEE